MRHYRMIGVLLLSLTGPPSRADEELPEGAYARLGSLKFRHGGPILSIAVSSDGRLLATGGEGTGVCLWDARTGELLRRLSDVDRPARTARRVELSPDGSVVVARLHTDQVEKAPPAALCVWDADGKLLFKREIADAGTFALFPDGKIVAVASTNAILLLDTQSGKETRKIAVDGLLPDALSVAADARTLACFDDSARVRLLDVATGRDIRSWQVKERQRRVEKLAFSPDGNTLAVSWASEGFLTVWNARTGKSTAVYPTRDEGRFFAFSPDSKCLVYGVYGSGIVERDPTTGRFLRFWRVPRRPFTLEFNSHTGALAFSPDGKILYGGELLLHRWDFATREELDSRAEARTQTAVLFTPDGRALLTQDSSGDLCRWTLEDGIPQRMRKVWNPPHKTLSVFSRDGSRIAGWNHSAMELRAMKIGEEDKAPTGLTLGRDGVILPVISSDGTRVAGLRNFAAVEVWDFQSGTLLAKCDVKAGSREATACTGACLSPDGSLLAVGEMAGKQVILYEVNERQERFRFPVGESSPSLAFAPDGETLASTVSDGNIALWDVRKGSQRVVCRSPNEETGSPVFSADGRLVAAAGARYRDPSIRIWEAATGRLLATFAGHRGYSHQLAFSADGRTLASGGGDLTVLLWDLTGRRGGKSAPPPATDAELRDRWQRLLDPDPAKAYPALWQLAGAKSAPRFLKGQLERTLSADEKGTAKLIAGLDDRQLRVRQEATRRLEELGLAAELPLGKALAGKPSLEVTRRIEGILDRVRDDPRRVGVLRVLQVLEYGGTAEAVSVLRGWAEAGDRTLLGRESQSALKRLAERGVT